MSSYETETQAPDSVVHVHHYLHFPLFGWFVGLFGRGGTVPPADPTYVPPTANGSSNTTTRRHSLQIKSPREELLLWLLGLAMAVLLVFLGWALFDWVNNWGDNGSSNATRVITVQDFVKSRGINTAKPVPAKFTMLPNGKYAVTLLRHGDQGVNLKLEPGTMVNVVRNAGFRKTTATLTYNYWPLFSVPVHDSLGDGYNRPAFNDPYAPHSGGKAVTNMIANLARTPAGQIASWHLRLVTIRTPQLK